MKFIKNLLIISTLALAISACGTNPSQGTNEVQIEKVGNQTSTEALLGYFWDWLWGTGTSAPAPDVTERPSDREQVICTTWCPSGYTRRDVTIGPSCAWYVIGKCVDNTSYLGESCGFGAKECVSGLACEQATAEETSRNAHNEACH